jgi:hypothetical protein
MLEKIKGGDWQNNDMLKSLRTKCCPDDDDNNSNSFRTGELQKSCVVFFLFFDSFSPRLVQQRPRRTR